MPAPDGFVPADGGDGGRDMADASADLAMCASSASCTDPMPICATGLCRACSGSTDDNECKNHNAATPRCGSAGTCVACRSDTQATDCAAATPICGTNNTCRKCQSHSECSSGVCKFDGRCALASDVAYVDDKGMTIVLCGATGTHDGNSPATAFCDVQNGVDSGKAYVLVTGHLNAPYGKVSVTTSKTVTLVGPGQGVAQPATIFDVANDEVTLNIPGGANAGLTVDGLEIGDRANPTGQNGVVCNAGGGATATLTIRRSAIQNQGKTGLTATSCALTMDQVVTLGNAGGGLVLTGTDFTISNVLVDGNGGSMKTVGGIQVVSPGTAGRANLVNTTIVENTAKNMVAVYSGLNCGAVAVNTVNTVIKGNLLAPELGGACAFDHSAFDGAPSPGVDTTGCMEPNLFVNSAGGDFHPAVTATAPCTKVLNNVGTSTGAPDHDLTGAPRPQPAGSMPDIGAYEAP